MTRKEAGSNPNRFNFRGLEAYRRTLPESKRYETFQFLPFGMRWDIVKVRFLIEKTNKWQAVLNVPDAARFLGLDYPPISDEEPKRFRRFASGFYVDPETAMSDKIDTNIPVIVANLQDDEVGDATLLIDGLHRLYKAHQEEKETIPCYILT
jgi:hypothetical protein